MHSGLCILLWPQGLPTEATCQHCRNICPTLPLSALSSRGGGQQERAARGGPVLCGAERSERARRRRRHGAAPAGHAAGEEWVVAVVVGVWLAGWLKLSAVCSSVLPLLIHPPARPTGMPALPACLPRLLAPPAGWQDSGRPQGLCPAVHRRAGAARRPHRLPRPAKRPHRRTRIRCLLGAWVTGADWLAAMLCLGLADQRSCLLLRLRLRPCPCQ